MKTRQRTRVSITSTPPKSKRLKIKMTPKKNQSLANDDLTNVNTAHCADPSQNEVESMMTSNRGGRGRRKIALATKNFKSIEKPSDVIVLSDTESPVKNNCSANLSGKAKPKESATSHPKIPANADKSPGKWKLRSQEKVNCGEERDDFLLSQQIEPYSEVGWKSWSPTTGGNETEDTAEVVMKFMKDSDGAESKRINGTPPLLNFWIKSPLADNQSTPNSPAVVNRFHRSRLKHAKRVKASVNSANLDIFKKLASLIEDQAAPEKTGEVSKEETKIAEQARPTKASESGSDNTFDNSEELFTATVNKPAQVTPKGTPKLCKSFEDSTPTGIKTFNESNEDLWTDDDMFETDSFIKATQDIFATEMSITPKSVKSSTPRLGTTRSANNSPYASPKMGKTVSLTNSVQCSNAKLSIHEETKVNNASGNNGAKSFTSGVACVKSSTQTIISTNTNVINPTQPGCANNAYKIPVVPNNIGNSATHGNSQRLPFQSYKSQKTAVPNNGSFKVPVPNTTSRPFNTAAAVKPPTSATNFLSSKSVPQSTSSFTNKSTSATAKNVIVSTTNSIISPASSYKPNFLNSESSAATRNVTSANSFKPNRSKITPVISNASNTKTVNTNFRNVSVKPIASSLAKPMITANIVNTGTKSTITTKPQESSDIEDTSLTDDILASLMEPDDSLDTQMCLFDSEPMDASTQKPSQTFNKPPNRPPFNTQLNFKRPNQVPNVQFDYKQSQNTSKPTSAPISKPTVTLLNTKPIINSTTATPSLNSKPMSSVLTPASTVTATNVPEKPNPADLDAIQEDDVAEDELLAMLEEAESQASQELLEDTEATALQSPVTQNTQKFQFRNISNPAKPANNTAPAEKSRLTSASTEKTTNNVAKPAVSVAAISTLTAASKPAISPSLDKNTPVNATPQSQSKVLSSVTANTRVTPSNTAHTKLTPSLTANTKITPTNMTNTKLTPSHTANTKITPTNMTNTKLTPSHTANTKLTPSASSFGSGSHSSNTRLTPSISVTDTTSKPNVRMAPKQTVTSKQPLTFVKSTTVSPVNNLSKPIVSKPSVSSNVSVSPMNNLSMIKPSVNSSDSKPVDITNTYNAPPISVDTHSKNDFTGKPGVKPDTGVSKCSVLAVECVEFGSQPMCSPDEIEKKRRLAMQKRQKLNKLRLTKKH